MEWGGAEGERESKHAWSGEGQRERESQGDSALSVEPPGARSHDPETITRAEQKSRTFN